MSASKPPTTVVTTADPPEETGEPEFTYASKVPPDHPGLHLDKPRSRTLRAGPAAAAAAVLLLASGVAVAVATRSSKDPPAPDKAAQRLPTSASPVPIADAVRAVPGNEAPIKIGSPLLGPPLHGAVADRGASTTSADGPSTTRAASPERLQRQARRQALLEEAYKAQSAPVLATLDEPEAAPAAATPATPTGKAAPAGSSPISDQPAVVQAAAPGPGAGAPDQNMQQRKNEFLATSGVNTSTSLGQPIREPRSPFELLAGAIIPTSLITGIDSDLPGQIIGQVRENVYDTVTGRYLLIPQGSKLLATYDSMVGFGQQRVLVCWNRLIRPDGISISLECMPGADLSGYSGFADDVDHHWWRILTGVAIGSLISAGAQSTQGSVAGFQPSLPQLWVTGAAGGVNQATQQLTQKNLQIQPTIKIRPGFSVNVLVTKDIVLPPFK